MSPITDHISDNMLIKRIDPNNIKNVDFTGIFTQPNFIYAVSTDACITAIPPKIDALSTIGRRDGRFGTEAIVRRSDVPAGMKTSPITIEELFIFMAKEEK